MAAYALAKLGARARWLAPAALALVLVEFTCLPYPTIDPEAPSFYYELAKDPDDYALVDSAFSKNLYYQTIHGKRLMGGYLSRRPLEACRYFWGRPLLNELLAKPYRRTGRMFASEEDVAELRKLNEETVKGREEEA